MGADWREAWRTGAWRKVRLAVAAKKAARPKPEPAPSGYVIPDYELMEYFHRSAGQLGMAAQSYEPQGKPVTVTSPSISDQAAAAARQVRVVETALSRLEPAEQSTIRVCYQHRWAPYVETNAVGQMVLHDKAWNRYRNLAVQHGIAAGVLVSELPEGGAKGVAAGREQAEKAARLIAAVVAAHVAWGRARADQRRERREEKQRARERRDAYLDEVLGLSRREAQALRSQARAQQIVDEQQALAEGSS